MSELRGRPAVLRPLSDPGVLWRATPFVVVAVIAIALELVTATASSNRGVLIAAAVTMSVLVLATVGMPWRLMPTWSHAVIPLCFFVVVALLRAARGGDPAGYPPLMMLPIVWFALYGTRVQLRLALGGLAAAFVVPLLLGGPPSRSVGAWGVATLAIAVGSLAGPIIQRLVEQSRQRTADVAALGSIARALTAGLDPRPELCAAAMVVADAAFAVLFEPVSDGTLAATAGTLGIDLAELHIDGRAETSATAHVWASGEQLYVPDTATDPRASKRLNALTGSAALLIQPVTRNGRRRAVLVVGFSTSRARAPKPALEMVELVAAEIAAAIDRANLVEMLAEQAHTDPLTGAANRRHWDETIDRELLRARRTGESLTVALLDMDHFKAYNDAFGHTVGDALLQALVPAVRAELRTGDLIARWGGEEFALALPACDEQHASAIAARILAAIPGGQTASIGPDPSHDPRHPTYPRRPRRLSPLRSQRQRPQPDPRAAATANGPTAEHQRH